MTTQLNISRNRAAEFPSTTRTILDRAPRPVRVLICALSFFLVAVQAVGAAPGQMFVSVATDSSSPTRVLRRTRWLCFIERRKRTTSNRGSSGSRSG